MDKVYVVVLRGADTHLVEVPVRVTGKSILPLPEHQTAWDNAFFAYKRMSFPEKPMVHNGVRVYGMDRENTIVTAAAYMVGQAGKFRKRYGGAVDAVEVLRGL